MNHWRTVFGLLLTSLLATLSAGCGTASEGIKNTQITWAMPLEYYEMTDLEENAAYFNELLAEEGYAYELSFLPLKPEDYEDIISNGRTEGIDILSLGLGAGEGMLGNPQRLLEAGILYDLSDYLHSTEGGGLYDAFYGKLWDSLTIDGKNCVIPNQYGQDGTAYAAFRRDIFGDTVQWDGTVEGLLTLAEQAEIPEGMIPVLWGGTLPIIAVSMGYEYYNGFFISLTEESVQFPYRTKELQDVYTLLHERMHSGQLQPLANDAKGRRTIQEQNYAIWVDADWLMLRENAAREYVFVQFPFTFSTRISGGVGICTESDNKEAALELLTMLFTQERYANALIWGEPGVMYELADGFAIYEDPDQHGSALAASLMTGLFDLVYPQESDDFPVNRRDTKWSLYDTEAEKKSPTAGLLPDLSGIQAELLDLAALAAEYESVWQRENFAAALEEANRQYAELDGDRIAAELEKLLKE